MGRTQGRNWTQQPEAFGTPTLRQKKKIKIFLYTNPTIWFFCLHEKRHCKTQTGLYFARPPPNSQSPGGPCREKISGTCDPTPFQSNQQKTNQMKKYAIIGLFKSTPYMLERSGNMVGNITLTPTPRARLFLTRGGAERYIAREIAAGTGWTLGILTIEEVSQ
jgi:hypothetical protein